tara:strand:- start:215 stop:1276 length:1062 start_codon:yes stop_codon:yes gene_type:complete
MKNVNYLCIVLTSLILASCSKVVEPVKKAGLGSLSLNYEVNESKDSLVIPPDLTSPNVQGIFVDKVEVDDDIVILKKSKNVKVMRDNYRRWLLVDLPPEEVWTSSKEFFRSYGFNIENENQSIGIFETEFLEIETKVPEKSLGAIRTALAKALKTQYGLPIADKYRVRIEPTENSLKSEIYVTLSSIGEVTSGAMRVWQPRDKDVEIETEMLLKLMVFLGSDNSDAIAQIKSNLNLDKGKVILSEAEQGYPILLLPLSKKESWSFIGWALDELNVDINDRDELAGSYFIKVTPDRGFFSKLINTVSSVKTYQLVLKENTSSMTKVIFVDLEDKNDNEAIQYSTELFGQISAKF